MIAIFTTLNRVRTLQSFVADNLIRFIPYLLTYMGVHLATPVVGGC